MKKDKYHIVLIASLVLLFIVSNFLLFILGETSQNITVNLLYGLAFVPVEVYATVFLLERFLNRRDRIREELREDSDYFSIAKEAQEQLIWSIKQGLLENFMGTTSDVEANFELLYQERKKILTVELWQKNLLKEHLLISSKKYMIDEDQFEEKDVTALELSTEVGEYITKEITEFYSIYLKFIPLDIFKELHGIYKVIEAIYQHLKEIDFMTEEHFAEAKSKE
ncbi:hypothetical protein IGL98_002077 [Enterococcus sp. DIV0840]|uniref:hypothetical protein n=1 Tax=Enterococcus TaxID=1350 RepID=UPI001A8D16BC|nr:MULTISPECIES: hypothetical protein [Enterococcus]MBO0433491.1 hypothetical protein [Enterococcus sp. DIV0849a]MBO0472437.1 hypothetical protein [Enterococcus ureasiticus]